MPWCGLWRESVVFVTVISIAMRPDTCGPGRLSIGLGVETAYLTENDSYAYFAQLGDLIRIGPSGTNVGDLQVVLTADRGQEVTV